MYVYKHVCVCVYLYLCVNICTCVCLCVWMSECLCMGKSVVFEVTISLDFPFKGTIVAKYKISIFGMYAKWGKKCKM